MPLGREIGDWNYGGQPETNQKDRIRLMVGDTDSNHKLVSDAAIRLCISQTSSDLEAAYEVCQLIKAEAAKYAAKSAGGYSESLGEVYAHYEALAQDLLRRMPLGIPKAPQLSRTRREDFQQDTDLPEPAFSTGMLGEDALAIDPKQNTIPGDDPFRN